MDVVEFDPHTADVRDLEGIVGVISACRVVDRPELPPVTFQTVVGSLKNPQPNVAPVRHWFAREGDRIVALASLCFPPAENSALSLCHLHVHPDVRRHGVGTTVLRTIAPALRAAQRSVVESWNVPKGSAGEWFGASLGFRVVCTTVFQTLAVADFDASAEVAPVKGYRLQAWSEAAPDELVGSYALARRAIADSPFGQSAWRFPEWTAQRVRADEEHRRRAGIEHRIVAAVHEDTGAVAGLTELNRYPQRTDIAYQGDTAVLAGHRGHDLGYRMKASMLRWLRAEHPGFEHVYTSTASANAHMIAVNHRLGYRDYQQNLTLAHDPRALC